jgi:hypothetical protein
MPSAQYHERKLRRDKEINSKSIVVIGEPSGKIATFPSRLFALHLLLDKCYVYVQLGWMLHGMQMYELFQFMYNRFFSKISLIWIKKFLNNLMKI